MHDLSSSLPQRPERTTTSALTDRFFPNATFLMIRPLCSWLWEGMP